MSTSEAGGAAYDARVHVTGASADTVEWTAPGSSVPGYEHPEAEMQAKGMSPERRRVRLEADVVAARSTVDACAAAIAGAERKINKAEAALEDARASKRAAGAAWAASVAVLTAAEEAYTAERGD